VITSSIFYKTLKSDRKDERFEAIQKTFPNCSVVKNSVWNKCNLAIIQGWSKPGSDTPHNMFRRYVIEKQKNHGGHILTVDGNIFNYLSKNVYFRYSMGGIFANTGYYFDKEIDPNRWLNISKVTGCKLKPWRKTGDHILILMQKSSGWTMSGIDGLKWCTSTIKKIREYSDRDIVIRLHPTDNHLVNGYISNLEKSRVTISRNKSILEDLKNAWCSITYNSSPGAVSAIEGVPAFIMDPDWKKSPVADVGNYDVSMLESPYVIDREAWIQKIAMSHYSIQDIKDGILWKEVTKYLDVGKI
jgi:hypothetical protein